MGTAFVTPPRPDATSTPEVTVVVPAFNAARYLGATLESLLAQQDVTMEVIVVDDCSTDDTAARVAEATARDSRVRYLRTSSNSGGPASPRNIGVQSARAGWVALCDADDLWHPRKLRLQLDVATRGRADLVCTAIRDFADGVAPSMSPPPTQPVVQRLPYWQMLLKDRIATSSVLCRREALLNDGGFDTALELVAVEDYDLWLRLMERPGFRVLRIDWPAVAYRRLPGSLSARKWRHAIKVMRVPRRASERQGWRWAYPLALPLIVAGYGLLSVYWRVLRGRL
jgi:glycosyltransferase involved in cell wall biosynthesis